VGKGGKGNEYKKEGSGEYLGRHQLEEQLEAIEQKISQLNVSSIGGGYQQLSTLSPQPSHDRADHFFPHSDSFNDSPLLDEATIQLIERTVQNELEPLQEEFLLVLQDTTELLQKIEKYEATPYPKTMRGGVASEEPSPREDTQQQRKTPRLSTSSSTNLQGPLLSRSVELTAGALRREKREQRERDNNLSKSTEL
jgi:hypothetical protein